MDSLVMEKIFALPVFLQHLIIVVATFFLAKFSKLILLKNIKRLTTKTSLKLDDAMIEATQRIGNYFLFILALWIDSLIIPLPDNFNQIIKALFVISLGFETAKFVNKILEASFEEISNIVVKKSDQAILNLIIKILKIGVWGISILLVLQNLGYNISTLIAGLGVGGIAVAFALQNILSDIFASFSILFDKPFEINDYIIVGNNKGTIKKIGIKTTRIESVEGEELIIPNKFLTETIVHNYGRIKHRRINFSIGVTYNTSNEKIKRAKQIISQAITKQNSVQKLDRVHFKSFGDFALIIDVVYFLNTPDYKDFLRTQEKINLEIKENFEKEGIEFAYPTQTIILERNS